jgi:hypothetical protein
MAEDTAARKVTSPSSKHGPSSRRKPAAAQYVPSATKETRSSSPTGMPSSMLERTRALALTLPRVAALNAPAS